MHKKTLTADIYVDKTMLINELNRFINTGKVLFVGINYDKDECEITEWEK